MIAQRKKIFQISKNPIVTIQTEKSSFNSEKTTIKYFTDSVYNPLVYEIPYIIQEITNKQAQINKGSMSFIKMNFEFLISETKTHKKIFDNIGIINIRNGQCLLRYGILVTEQKGQIFVSLIE